MSCGRLLLASRELKIAASEDCGAKLNVNVPFPSTRLVTSKSTHERALNWRCHYAGAKAGRPGIPRDSGFSPGVAGQEYWWTIGRAVRGIEAKYRRLNRPGHPGDGEAQVSFDLRALVDSQAAN